MTLLRSLFCLWRSEVTLYPRATGRLNERGKLQRGQGSVWSSQSEKKKYQKKSMNREKKVVAPNLVGKLINLWKKCYSFLGLSHLDKLKAVTTNVLLGLSCACRSRVSPGIPLRMADL